MQNLSQTVISQYANSPVMLALLQSLNANIDPSQNITNFYNDMWDIATASGYGLDCWGRIVGVSRTVQTATAQYFGFAESGTLNALSFHESGEVGCFYNGERLLYPYELSDTDFRTLILAKAAANIWDGSIPGLNAILRALFTTEAGNAYVVDNGNMSLTYVFEFPLTAVQLAIVSSSGVLPRPAGVQANTLVIP